MNENQEARCVERPEQFTGVRNAEPLPPSNSRIYEIHIQAKDYGFNVRVGCREFAIETKETLLTKIMQYINDPVETEKKWNDGSLFK